MTACLSVDAIHPLRADLFVKTAASRAPGPIGTIRSLPYTINGELQRTNGNPTHSAYVPDQDVTALQATSHICALPQ